MLDMRKKPNAVQRVVSAITRRLSCTLAFEQEDAMQHLEAFASLNGPEFYNCHEY